MKLSKEAIRDAGAWQALDVKLPVYDVEAMRRETMEAPVWVHFGAGNIFRIFIAGLAQQLLNTGTANKGIVAAETFDTDIIGQIYEPFDDLTLAVGLHPDGRLEKEIIASVAESIKVEGRGSLGLKRLKQIFSQPSLQMASLTVTEKGYAIRDGQGAFIAPVEKEIAEGPAGATHVICVLTALMDCRYRAGAHPIALVSMDNCSENGEKLRDAVLAVARAWIERGAVAPGLFDYLADENKVSFPWSMIDKITPRPNESVCQTLTQGGIEDLSPIVTSKNTFIAPFVNAEIPQYLVVEDRFPAGRPPLEQAGVLFTARETVSNCERMKVTTCLNPLHTALAVYGCLLGYSWIYEEMRDPSLAKLAAGIGQTEGLPVVTDPGILRPADFLKEVIEQRLANPYIPDMPQRIATDSSLKIPIRFGETMKAYAESADLDIQSLHFIPLAIAGWFRYLLAVDDEGRSFEPSSDPALPKLTAHLAGIDWDRAESYQGQLAPILKDEGIFGLDLIKAGLSGKVEGFFVEMLAGKGAVRSVLEKYTIEKIDG